MQQGLGIQVFMPYSDRLYALGYWFRQLASESLGKNGKGFTPVTALGSVDQHSMVQLFLDGPNDKWYSFIIKKQSGRGAVIPRDIPLKGCEYAQGKTIGDIMDSLQHGTIEAFARRKKPLRVFHVEQADEATFGALMMHFMLETVITADLMGINAFDQPAVEDGKKIAKAYLEALP